MEAQSPSPSAEGAPSARVWGGVRGGGHPYRQRSAIPLPNLPPQEGRNRVSAGGMIRPHQRKPHLSSTCLEALQALGRFRRAELARLRVPLAGCSNIRLQTDDPELRKLVRIVGAGERERALGEP